MKLFSPYKKNRTMFLLFFFLGIFTVSTFASNLSDREELRQERYLSKVIDEIEEAYQVFFNYDSELIRNVRVQFELKKGESLTEAVKRLLNQTNLEYEITSKKFIILYKDDKNGKKKARKIKRKIKQISKLEKEGEVSVQRNSSNPVDRSLNIIQSILAQKADRLISGIVKDADGVPLIGATIVVKETGQGTVTDLDGSFSIAIPDDREATLVISYTGFETQEILTNGSEAIDVFLKESAAILDEIVVIGYGSQSKTKLNGATSKIKTEEINKFSASSFDQQLTGRLAGVQVNQVNGQPGSDTQINIRGLGTLTAGSSPLIVVDGVPLAEGSSLSSISPNDIETIDILKDAASASIYGSRAGNGVILVTTKSGQSGKVKIAVDVYSGIQKRADKVEFADAYQAAQFFTEARDQGYVSRDPVNRKASDDEATRLSNGANKRELRLDYLEPYLANQPGLTNTDWLDVIFRDAQMNNISVSLSGGNDNGNYFVSANYFKQDGLALGTDFERFSSSIKINSGLGERLKLGFSLNPSYSRQGYADLGDWSGDPIAASMTYYPFFDAYNEDGSIVLSQGQILNTPADGSLQENPLAYTQLKDDRLRFRMFGNSFLSFDILKGLKLKTVFGGDYRNDFFDFYKPSFLGQYRAIAPVPARTNETNARILSYLSENTLSYKRILGAHELDLLAGYTYQKENGTRSIVVGTNIQDDILENVSGASDHTLNTFRYTWVQISYLSRVQYFFKDRYHLSAAIRRDGSSRFGDDTKWGTFPSVSAGWILSDEPFFPQSRILNYTKFRASWGITGNNQIGSYSSQALLAPSNYVYDGTLGAGFASSTSPNNKLSWETNTSYNIGLDIGLWNRLNVSANYYHSITSDLLLSVPVPQQSGFSTSLQNIGEVKNQGFELELSGSGLDLGPVKWTYGANLTTNTNEVLALAEGQEEIRAGQNGEWRTKVGGPIGNITAYNIIGVYKTAEEINASAHLSGTLTGDLIVEDVNNDGAINDDDKIALGTFAPELTFGFSSTFQYNNFDLSFAINGVSGRSAYFWDEAFITGVGEGFGAPSKYYFENRYHPENNPDGFLGQPNLGNFSSNRRNTRVSSLYVQDADYIRMRYLQIGYTFPERWLADVGLSQLRFYVTANNLFTITDYRGYNPDSSEYRQDTDVLQAGFARANYPVAKSFLFGFNLNF